MGCYFNVVFASVYRGKSLHFYFYIFFWRDIERYILDRVSIIAVVRRSRLSSRSTATRLVDTSSAFDEPHLNLHYDSSDRRKGVVNTLIGQLSRISVRHRG